MGRIIGPRELRANGKKWASLMYAASLLEKEGDSMSAKQCRDLGRELYPPITKKKRNKKKETADAR